MKDTNDNLREEIRIRLEYADTSGENLDFAVNSMEELLESKLSEERQRVRDEMEKLKTRMTIFGEKDEKNDGMVMGIDFVLDLLNQNKEKL